MTRYEFNALDEMEQAEAVWNLAGVLKAYLLPIAVTCLCS